MGRIRALFNSLKEKSWTITTAESVTGGTLASKMTIRPGASEYLRGGFVCYSAQFKYDVLGVSQDIDIVSEEMAKELAISARKIAKTDIAISFTGNSSANGLEDKEKGMVYIGIATKDEAIAYKYHSEEKSRVEIIDDFVEQGVEYLIEFLN